MTRSRRRIQFIIFLVAATVLLPYLYSRIRSPWQRVRLDSSLDSASRVGSAEEIRIACYNIAHGRGIASSNWEGGNARERLARLDAIADLLRTMDADVLVLNEVDFDSSWSYSMNQARYLAQQAGYPYWVEARNLDFRVLVWKWRFGNAILSKHPIIEARVVDLPNYSTLETLLAGKKRGILSEIRVHDRTIQVIGVHLCHRSELVRVQSAYEISSIARRSSFPTFVAGDLNSTPPRFPEYSTDGEGRNAISVFDESKVFRRHPSLPPTDESQFTFHSVEPACVIDWVLIPVNWEFSQYEVVSSQLSDHRPVYADVTFNPAARSNKN
jgi:endonuclease/exonuclease/phosphatase family metal-dependent hydrolase